MIYTAEDLKNMLKTPIEDTKWGQDTHKMVSLIKKINDSSCTSCSLRKNVANIKKILNKYGDDIVYSPSSYRVINRQNTRIPCNDCVAKHLSQAYVLQSEFFQGYTDYLALIEAHLNEAYEECPPDSVELRVMIRDAIKKTVIDRIPDVPLVVFDNSTNNSDTRPVNVNDLSDTVDVRTTQPSEIDSWLKNVRSRTLMDAYRIFTSYNVDRFISAMNNRDYRYMQAYLGHIAQISEFVAKESPELSKLLRSRRLDVQSCISSETLDDVNIIWVSNDDVVEAIKKILKIQ